MDIQGKGGPSPTCWAWGHPNRSRSASSPAHSPGPEGSLTPPSSGHHQQSPVRASEMRETSTGQAWGPKGQGAIQVCFLRGQLKIHRKLFLPLGCLKGTLLLPREELNGESGSCNVISNYIKLLSTHEWLWGQKLVRS